MARSGIVIKQDDEELLAGLVCLFIAKFIIPEWDTFRLPNDELPLKHKIRASIKLICEYNSEIVNHLLDKAALFGVNSLTLKDTSDLANQAINHQKYVDMYNMVAGLSLLRAIEFSQLASSLNTSPKAIKMLEVCDG